MTTRLITISKFLFATIFTIAAFSLSSTPVTFTGLFLTCFVGYCIGEGVGGILEMFNFTHKISRYFEKRREAKAIKKTSDSLYRIQVVNSDIEKTKVNLLLELEEKLSDVNTSEDAKEKMMIDFLEKKDKFDSLHERTKNLQNKIQNIVSTQRMNVNRHSDGLLNLHFSTEGELLNDREFTADELIRETEARHEAEARRVHMANMLNIASIHDEMEDSYLDNSIEAYNIRERIKTLTRSQRVL